MAATKRAAVYLRVSTDRQTVQNQLADLEGLVQARGFEGAIYRRWRAPPSRDPSSNVSSPMPSPGGSTPWRCGRSTVFTARCSAPFRRCWSWTGWACRFCRCGRDG